MVNKISTPFAYETDGEAILALQAEGARLKYIALKIWRAYLAEYKPAEYARTRASQRGIKLGKVKRLDALTWGIELTFEDDLMYHDSVVKSTRKKHPKGHSIMLISEGWKNKRGHNRDVYRFGYFEGIDYIGRVQRAFEKSMPTEMSMEITWDGKPFKKENRNRRRNVLKK